MSDEPHTAHGLNTDGHNGDGPVPIVFTWPDGSQLLVTSYPDGHVTAARRHSTYGTWGPPVEGRWEEDAANQRAANQCPGCKRYGAFFCGMHAGSA